MARVKTKKDKFSFTIIEVIVIMAIIAIVSGWLLVGSFFNYNEGKRLEMATQKFIQILEIAKKKALTGDRPASCSNLSSYKVTYGSGSLANYYQMSAQCPADVTVSPSLALSANNQNIIFTSAGTVLFMPLGLGASLNPAVSCINIKNTRINKCFKITIEKSGMIEEAKDENCAC